jgi:DNA-binding CsgD family transcriptional regulator/alpha-beta hydrolase superfamily lysophospholipase
VAFLGHSQPTHSGLLEGLGRAFAEAGCEACSGDVRGHGMSVDLAHPLGHLPRHDGWHLAAGDMRRLLEHAFAGVPWEERIVVVPNITALLTLEVMKDWPDLARHVVLISPVPNQRPIALFGKAFSQARLMIRGADEPDEHSLHHLYAFLGAHLKERTHPADVMSSDKAVIQRVISDPLGWPTPTPSYWLNIFTGMLSAWQWPRSRRVRSGSRCLILFGGEDAMLRDGGFLPPVVRVLKAVGFESVDAARVEGGRSALFLEEERLGISARVLAWTRDAWQPAVDPEPVEISTVASDLLDRMGTGISTGKLSPGELIELCYNAVEDERRWIEIMYRIMSETQTTGADEKAVQERIDQLMPHWERAYQLKYQVMMSATLGVLLQSVVDRLGIGVGILDGRHQLIHANEAFGRALAGLLDRDVLSEKDISTLATKLVSEGSAQQVIDGADRVVMYEGSPVGFLFHPPALQEAGLDRRGPASILVLKAGSGGDVESETRRSLLEISYGLTGKEAQVALCIAEGMSPEESARRLGISTGTVRSHLKRCFQKMSVRSQAELAARIMSGPLGWL